MSLYNKFEVVKEKKAILQKATRPSKRDIESNDIYIYFLFMSSLSRIQKNIIT